MYHEAGFADNLFASSLVDTYEIGPADCGKQRITKKWSGVGPFSSRAIVIQPASVPGIGDGPTLSVKFLPAFGDVGTSWDGYSLRNNAVDRIKAVNTHPAF